MLKRAFDIVFSACWLLGFAPLLLVVAILVRLRLGSPVPVWTKSNRASTAIGRRTGGTSRPAGETPGACGLLFGLNPGALSARSPCMSVEASAICHPQCRFSAAPSKWQIGGNVKSPMDATPSSVPGASRDRCASLSQDAVRSASGRLSSTT